VGRQEDFCLWRAGGEEGRPGVWGGGSEREEKEDGISSGQSKRKEGGILPSAAQAALPARKKKKEKMAGPLPSKPSAGKKKRGERFLTERPGTGP